jgi:3-methyladenine DNA glycosylase AlkD
MSRFASFCAFALQMMHEKEFFIQKAIGWALREAAPKAPKLVFDFTLQHAADMSSVTFKEASRKLSAAQQKKLVAARNAGKKD